MSRNLDNTVALVTGASSGIGAATAKALAREGATVAIVARRRDRLEQVAKEIKDHDGNALVIAADITDPSQAAAAVETVVSELGRLDTVVNNAGLMLIGTVADALPGEWERMLAINIQAVLYITRAAIPHLLTAATNGPRDIADIVNISSTAGRVARPGNAVYTLTKFGIGAYTESLRQELMQQHIRVSVVEPGTVDTELASHVREDLQEAIARQTADMEKLRPEDIADAVSYIVTRDRRVAVNEMLVRASDQTW